MQRSNEMEKEIVAELGHKTLLHDYQQPKRCTEETKCRQCVNIQPLVQIPEEEEIHRLLGKEIRDGDR